MPIGGIISGIAGIADGIFGGGSERRAIEEATRLQNETSNRALDIVESQFDTVQENNRPRLEVGNSALAQLAALYGFPDPTARPSSVPALATPTFLPTGFNTAAASADRGTSVLSQLPQVARGATTASPAATGVPNSGAGLEVFTASPEFNLGSIFQADPGYQFRLDEGIRAIDNAASAQGLINSGSRLKDLTRFAQGTASQEFGKFENRFNNFTQRLFNLAGLGQAATESNNAFGTNAANNAAGIVTANGSNLADGALAAGASSRNSTNSILSGLGEILGNERVQGALGFQDAR